MKTPKYLYPLRRVIDRASVEIEHTGVYATQFVLDCGHQHPQPRDMFGEYYPDRMRCRKCWDVLTDTERAERIERSQVSRANRKRRQWHTWRESLDSQRGA